MQGTESERAESNEEREWEGTRGGTGRQGDVPVELGGADERRVPEGEKMSISAANLSTKAKIVERLPSFSEEVISNKLPRSWNDLPDHLLEMIFHSLTKDDKEGRVWVSSCPSRRRRPPLLFFLDGTPY